MPKNWIFTVTNLETSQKSWGADEIFENRVKIKLWGIKEKNPLLRQLFAGDNIIFHVSTGTTHAIAGKTVLKSSPRDITDGDKKILVPFDPCYSHVVELNEIQLFERHFSIKEYLDDLSFILNKEKWGAYLQGGITRISDTDYDLLVSAGIQGVRIRRSPGFEGLILRASYDSSEDDIVNDFYVLALSRSTNYKRLAGFFSSSALAVAARGISRFIANGGRMKLIAGAKLRKSDVEAIAKGQDPKTVISSIVIDDINSMENEFIRDHVAALAWMVANKRLDIRIAIATGEDGTILSEEATQEYGMFHQKVGILEDGQGSMISFSGSVNESAMGWLHNVEEFKVFRSWIEHETPYLKSDYQKFERYWNGSSKNVIVLDVPTAIKDKLIKLAPDKIENMNLERWYKRKMFNPNNLVPWTCQRKAIEVIKHNDYNGVLKMATGTGKTSCALFILEKFFNEVKSDSNRILVLVPSGKDRVGGQWEKFLRQNSSSKDYVYRYDSQISIQEKRDTIRLWKDGVANGSNIYVIVTIHSLENFQFNDQSPDFLIADEVHEYGTEDRINIIKAKLGAVRYRVGLSATPERFYDQEGTENILNYFGPVVFRYTLREAQNEEKYPGAETVLAKYFYYLYITNLTKEEEEKVKELTSKIGQNIAMGDDPTISESGHRLPDNIKRLLEMRAKILKTSENKLVKLREILTERAQDLKQCIVYCEDIEQLNKVGQLFRELGMTSYVKYHYDVKNRTESLDLFRENNCNFILSINCLDQGIDIPSCQSLILLTGSTNPRQYIQRRGRVLRNYKSKPPVNIFDILAFPTEINESYKGLVRGKLLEAWEFIASSESPEEKAKVMDLRTNYGLSVDELNKEIEKW